MNIYNDNLTPEEQLRAQNEIEALKLEMNGGTVSILDDAPPRLVAQFFRNIDALEKADSNRVTIGNYINYNKLKFHLEDLTETEYELNCHRINQELLKNQIFIEKPKFKNWEHWFEFLTTALMEEEITIKDIDGYQHYLDYNEFFEDDPEYISINMHNELELIFNQDESYEGLWLGNKEYDDEVVLDMVDNINGFRLSYNELELIEYQMLSLTGSDEEKTLTFMIEWEGEKGGSFEHITKKGKGVAKAFLQDNMWMLESITFPGLEA